MKLFKRGGKAENEDVPQVVDAGGSQQKRLAELEDDMSLRTKGILAGVLVVLALTSFFLIGSVAENPETYTDTVAALDESRNNVAAMTAGALAVSVGASMVPGDAGKPVSEALTNVIGGLAIVLAVIMLEKYLLTIFGFAAFKVLVPIACLLLLVTLFMRKTFALRSQLLSAASKFIAFGLVLFLAIPVSVGMSEMMRSSYEAQFQETLEVSDTIAEITKENQELQAAEGEQGEPQSSEQSQGFLESMNDALADVTDAASKIPENVTKLPGKIADSASGAASEVADRFNVLVNRFVEGFAVMVVTSCFMPLLVLVVFFWFANVVLGLNVSIPKSLPKIPHRAVTEENEA